MAFILFHLTTECILSPSVTVFCMKHHKMPNAVLFSTCGLATLLKKVAEVWPSPFLACTCTLELKIKQFNRVWLENCCGATLEVHHVWLSLIRKRVWAGGNTAPPSCLHSVLFCIITALEAKVEPHIDVAKCVGPLTSDWTMFCSFWKSVKMKSKFLKPLRTADK